MKSMSRIVLLGFALVVGGIFGAVADGAQAAEDQKVMQFVLCKNQKTVRTIRIAPERAEPQDCQVMYSKAGVDEVVGQSRSLSSCKSILKNIQENLEASKWNCKQVDSAKVSYSKEVTVQ